ncbi:MAG: 3-isopropylmalate dehydratase small subunit [Anaerolineae bacterium]
MSLFGKVHKYGDDIDTDVIFPGKYLSITEPRDMAPHCLEGIDPEFSKRVRQGDIVVAGENFGSGSSREQAPLALANAGVACVVAKSFARIFYRNAINLALPILVSPEAVAAAEPGDEMGIDLGSGVMTVRGQTFRAAPFPPELQQLMSAGGLVAYVRQELARCAAQS